MKKLKKKNIFLKKSKAIRQTLAELIKLTEEKGVEGGAQQIGETHIYWRIIPQVNRCPKCKRPR